MPKQTVQVGAAANDGTGDTLRNAMIKIVANTTELYDDVATIGAPEGVNVKSTGEVGGDKFLGEDGDGTSSWKVPAGGGNVTASNNFSEYSATLTAARAGLGLSYGTTSGTVSEGNHNHNATYATTVQGGKADTALQPADIGGTVQGYTAALAGTNASYTTTIDGEVVQLRTDVDTFGLLIAGLARTVRDSTFTDTTTDADFNTTILMLNTHMVELHPVADAARLGQRITFRLRGATQQTIGPGTATIEGAAIINQNETVVAELVEVGSGTDTVWALTGGGV